MRNRKRNSAVSARRPEVDMGGHGQETALGLIASYLQAGGMVMPILLLVTVLLWYALGVRWVLLRRGSAKNVRVLLKRGIDGRSNAPNGIVDLAVARGLARKRRGLPDLRRRPTGRATWRESMCQYV